VILLYIFYCFNYITTWYYCQEFTTKNWKNFEDSQM